MPILVAFIVCSVLTPLLAHLAVGVGLVDRPSSDDLKIHSEPKPLAGGAAIVFAVFIAVAVAGSGSGAGLEPWSIAAVLLLLVVGLGDDARGLPPTLRLAVQLLSGLLLALGGLTFAPLGALGPFVVVAGVPALANAVNLTDGQDGLAAGLSLVSILGMWAIIGTAGAVDGVAASSVGALLGFLVWNRPPAAVFLGDGGAYAVGGLLVVIATASTGSWASFLGTVLCLSIFVFELTSTILRRATRPVSLVRGDREHLYDLLARHVGGRTRSTLLMWVAGALVALLGVVVARLALPYGIAIAIAIVVIGVVVARSLRRDPGTLLRRPP